MSPRVSRLASSASSCLHMHCATSSLSLPTSATCHPPRTMDKQSSTGGGPATYQQSLASSRPRGSRPPPAPTPPSPLASTALSHARSSRALSHSTQEGQPPAEDAPRVPLRGFGPASLRRAPPPMPTHPEAGLGAAGGLGAVGEGLGEEAGESEGTGAFWAGEV